MRTVLGFVAVSALAGAAGCDLVGSERQPLTASASVVEQEAAKALPDADAPETGAPQNASTLDASALDAIAPTALPGTYAAMCQHYCETLQETLVYSCLVSVAADDCVSRFQGAAAQCVDLRCASKLVTPSLCLVQCDALARNQSTYCETAPATVPVCASPQATQDEGCRSACTVGSP